LLRSGLESEEDGSWPFSTLRDLPPIPEAVDEIYGPKGIFGRLADRMFKSWNYLVDYVQNSGGGSVQLLFFAILIGWPILSQQLNNMVQSAAGVHPQSAHGNSNFLHSLPIGTEIVVEGLRQATEYMVREGRCFRTCQQLQAGR